MTSIAAANGAGSTGLKISDLIKSASQDNAIQKPLIAFEYYPPKTEAGVTNLKKRFANMAQQKPLYIDVTWGAGGSTSDLTLDLCIQAKEQNGLEPNMHLTCTNMDVEKITGGLEGAKNAGIRNIVALVSPTYFFLNVIESPHLCSHQPTIIMCILSLPPSLPFYLFPLRPFNHVNCREVTHQLVKKNGKQQRVVLLARWI
jgi:hypothetical protein